MSTEQERREMYRVFAATRIARGEDVPDYEKFRALIDKAERKHDEQSSDGEQTDARRDEEEGADK